MDGKTEEKDNVNPTILAVDHASARTRKRRQALEYHPELAALSAPLPSEQAAEEKQGNSSFGVSSSLYGTTTRTSTTAAAAAFAQDRRIMLQALTDAAEASKGNTVSLLRQHLIIPDNAEALQRALKHEPLFVPHPDSSPVVVKDESATATPSKQPRKEQQQQQQQPSQPDPVTPDEIFEIIRNIQDPEYPLTLEQLSVVSREQITIHENGNNIKTIAVRYTPTVPHCSMATLIGLTLSVKLWRSVQPAGYKVIVSIEPGTHASESAVNKQLSDKERVCAALENQHLLGVVNKCIANGMNHHEQ